MLEKILAVGLPRDNIRKPRTQLGILIVTGNLTSFETKARINPKTLIVEIPMECSVTVVEAHRIKGNIKTYSDPLAAEVQFIGRLIPG